MKKKSHIFWKNCEKSCYSLLLPYTAHSALIDLVEICTLLSGFNFKVFMCCCESNLPVFLSWTLEMRCKYLSNTMRKNLPKLSDLLIFCIFSLNFRFEFFIMKFFATNQLNILKFTQYMLRIMKQCPEVKYRICTP